MKISDHDKKLIKRLKDNVTNTEKLLTLRKEKLRVAEVEAERRAKRREENTNKGKTDASS